MNKKYIITLDQGTTSTRAILFDRELKIIDFEQQEIALYSSNNSIEQDANEILSSSINVIKRLMLKQSGKIKDIIGITITNQRETTIVFERDTGSPVYNAIVWQSKISESYCNELSQYDKVIREKTGLSINPYFSATKIMYILDQIENGHQRMNNNELLFGTVDTFILYHLTNKKVFKTDSTNASRTLLYNINTLEYDDELLSIFKINSNMLAEVVPSSYNFGIASTLFNLPILGIIGDQQAALIGHLGIRYGDMKTTYGTGCFLLVNTGEKRVDIDGLFSTIAYQHKEKTYYAIEGSIFVAGALIKWLRDDLHLIDTSSETEMYANKSKDSDNLFFVPSFLGLGAPYWDEDALGSIVGLTRDTKKEDVIRAALDSIILQSFDMYSLISSSIKINDFKVDGGVTNNKYFNAKHADLFQRDIYSSDFVEVTARGATIIGLITANIYSDLNELESLLIDTYHKYQPKISKSVALKKIDNYHLAIKATKVYKPK